MKFIIEWLIYTVCCIALGGVLTLAMLQQYILPTAEIDVKMVFVNMPYAMVSLELTSAGVK